MKRAVPLQSRGRRLALRLIRGALVLVLSAAVARSARGQAFVLTGGSSSMFEAHGASLEVRTPGYTSRLDLGYFDGPSFGFSVQHLYHDFLVNAGDQQIPFLLPTDIFDRSYYFLGRGLSAFHKSEQTKLFVFAGETSTGFWTPFLSVAKGGSLTGAIFYERQLTPSLRWFSRNIAARHQTSIQSLEWAARRDVRLALSAGIGNNQGYWASSFLWSDRWISVDASYARAGDSFRRVEVTTPELTENDRENVRVDFTPVQNVRIVASRNNYLSPFSVGAPMRAAVNGFGVWTGFAGNQFYASLYRSRTVQGASEAWAVGAHRTFTRRLEGGADFLGTTAAGHTSHTLVGTVRELLSPRLSLNQVITSGNGQSNVSFGGSFISNFATLSVDYQTMFLPFVPAGPAQFKRVVVIGLHLQLPRGIQLNADTSVTPLGQLRYTGYATTYEYRGLAAGSAGTSFSGGFLRNIVRGRVTDPAGQPIAGAALHIGNDLAVTDSDGNFMVRVKKPGELALHIAFEEFTAPGRYVIVESPLTVKATRVESAPDYAVVLKRVPGGVSSADPSHQTDLPDHPPGSN